MSNEAPAPAEVTAATGQRRREKRDVHGWVVLDKPVGMTSTHAVSVVKRAVQGASAPATPARSIRWRRACCRSRSARRPRPSRSSWTAARPTASPCAGARSATPTTPRAASSPPATRARRRTRFARCCRASPAPSRRCRRAIPRSRSTASAPTISPATARSSSSQPRPVEIHRLDLVETPTTPIHDRVFEAECGKGTYVRAIARDMGRALGCFGHVVGAAPHPGRPVRGERCGERRGVAGGCRRPDRPPTVGAPGAPLLPVEAGLAVAAVAGGQPRRRRTARPRPGRAAARPRRAGHVRAASRCSATASLIALAEVEQGELRPRRIFNLGQSHG